MPASGQRKLAACLLGGFLSLPAASGRAQSIVKSDLYGFSVRFPASAEQHELGPMGWTYAKSLVRGLRRRRVTTMSSWSGNDGGRGFDLVAVQLSAPMPTPPIQELCAKFNRRVPAMLANPSNRPPRIVDQPMTGASCALVALGKSPAMQITLKIEESGETLTRSAVIGRTFYQLTYQRPPTNYLSSGEKPTKEEGQQFFDSFEAFR